MAPQVAFVFPGQGAQRVGMGESLYRSSEAARAVFDAAERATGLPLTQVCLEGPPERLTDTAFAQPGVVAVSLAAAAALRDLLATWGVEVPPSACAGHSVGEFSALVASGAVSLEDGLRLVAARGRLMAAASAAVDGSMAAVLGLEERPLSEVCSVASEETGARVQIANLNAPGQIVISGDRVALARAGELARSAGAKRVVGLDVSGPFHSVYMQPAADSFRDVVAQTRVSSAACPLVLNVTAQATTDPEEIRREMVSQVTGAVRWADSARTLWDLENTVFVELGPGQVLSGLIKRIVKEATILNVEDEDSLKSTAERLRQLS